VRPLLAALDDAAATLAAVVSAVPDVERLVGIDWAAQAQRATTEAAELSHLVAVEAELSQRKSALAQARRDLRRTGELSERLAMRAAALPDELAAARVADAGAAHDAGSRPGFSGRDRAGARRGAVAA
jgi:hypothetical protein